MSLPEDGPRVIRWDFFLACSAKDVGYAEQLYVALTRAYKRSVFLYSKVLVPGDKWDEIIPTAQRESAITVVILSGTIDKQFYRSEEVARAIALARKGDGHRVVPIYLCPHIPNEAMDFGLQRLHAIVDPKSIGMVSAQLMHALSKSQLQSQSQPSEPVLQLPHGQNVSVPGNEESGLSKVSLEKTDGHNFLTNLLKTHRSKWRRTNRMASIVLLDVDELTLINKTYGKRVGDAVLSTLAEILSRTGGVFKGRCGDDTFYVVLEGLSPKDVDQFAEDLCSNVRCYSWSTIANGLHVTCSVGFAHLNRHEPSEDWPIRAALGLKQAKARGANRAELGPLFLPSDSSSSGISRDLHAHYS